MQLVNGLGSTESRNGAGNLIIGYDEERKNGSPQCSIGSNKTGNPVSDQNTCAAAGGIWALNHKSGSHYLVVGAMHNYSRWGGAVIGFQNTSNNDHASVTGGSGNIASGLLANVAGGGNNTASGARASIGGGGSGNTASGPYSSVGGGGNNTASGVNASVPGGIRITAGSP